MEFKTLYDDRIRKVQKLTQSAPIGVIYIVSRDEDFFTTGEEPELSAEAIDRAMDEYLSEKYEKIAHDTK